MPQHHGLHRALIFTSVCVMRIICKFSLTYSVLNVLCDQRHTVGSGHILHMQSSLQRADTFAASRHLLMFSSNLFV